MTTRRAAMSGVAGPVGAREVTNTRSRLLVSAFTPAELKAAAAVPIQRRFFDLEEEVYVTAKVWRKLPKDERVLIDGGGAAAKGEWTGTWHYCHMQPLIVAAVACAAPLVPGCLGTCQTAVLLLLLLRRRHSLTHSRLSAPTHSLSLPAQARAGRSPSCPPRRPRTRSAFSSSSGVVSRASTRTTTRSTRSCSPPARTSTWAPPSSASCGWASRTTGRRPAAVRGGGRSPCRTLAGPNTCQRAATPSGTPWRARPPCCRVVSGLARLLAAAAAAAAAAVAQALTPASASPNRRALQRRGAHGCDEEAGLLGRGHRGCARLLVRGQGCWR